MQLLRMIIAELCWRWGTALLAVLLVAAAVVSMCWADAVARGAADVTRRVQRDIGTNLVVLPPGTDTTAWLLHRRSSGALPMAAVDQLEASGLAGRLIPLVRRVVQVDGEDVLLTGVGQERAGGKRSVFARDVDDSGVVIGAAVAITLDVQVGDELDLPGGPAQITDVLLPEGSIDDTAVFMPLAQAQRRLHLEGHVTEIEALECRCSPAVADPGAHVVSLAETAVPGAVVIRRQAAAEARRKQRDLAEAIAAVAGPAAACAGLLLIAGMAWLNVRVRQQECGVLRALGWTRGALVVLLAGRWCCIGFDGAVIGLIIAMMLTEGAPQWWWALAAVPGAAVIASLLPAMLGASADPVEALRS